ACGAASRKVPTRGPLAPPKVELGELDARILLEDLPAHAMRIGAGPLSIVASGEASEGERIGAFVEIQEGACLLAYARGSTSVDDVDVAAFAEEGNPLASDEGPDAHPAIVLCPPHHERVYVVAHVASGEGLVALGAQEIPRERSAEIARAFNARGGGAGGTRAADAWPGLEDHVRQHRDSVGGTWEDYRRVAVTLDARAPTLVGYSLQANQCLDVLVIPDEDVALVELEAQDGAGRVVARARDGGRDRSVTLCSPIAFDGTLTLRPHVGSGLAAVVLGRASADRVRDLRGRATIAWAAASAPLEITRKTREMELTKRGYSAATTTSNGALVVGRRSTLTIDLAARGAKSNACTRVDVVGGEPLALIDAEIWDASAGQLVTRAQGSSSATVFSCARPKAEIDLEARGRPGPFSVMTRPERWQDPAFVAHPIAAARMLAASTTGTSSEMEGVISGVKTLVVDATHRNTFEDQIHAGQCFEFAFGGEGDGSGLEVRVFDAGSSEEIDRDTGAFSARLRACATPSQARTIRVETRVGGGKLDVIVGARTRPVN
ncbi:MAG: hypothetical protein ABI183_17415, partial [Polyangiaceae bacterium]